MPFLLNGSAASLAPFKQSWQDITFGQDHQGLNLFSSIKNCSLEFDNCSPALANQWTAFCNTGTSITSIQLLNLDATSFVTYSNSGIGLQLTRPPFESAYVGSWSVLVTGISFA